MKITAFKQSISPYFIARYLYFNTYIAGGTLALVLEFVSRRSKYEGHLNTQLSSPR